MSRDDPWRITFVQTRSVRGLSRLKSITPTLGSAICGRFSQQPSWTACSIWMNYGSRKWTKVEFTFKCFRMPLQEPRPSARQMPYPWRVARMISSTKQSVAIQRVMPHLHRCRRSIRMRRLTNWNARSTSWVLKVPWCTVSRGGLFLDDKRFWPILERAQALDVPIYLHPATPHPLVVQAYYSDRPALTRAGWGFGIECATQAMRMIVGGVFDEYPRLKIILGHLGEGLPFLLWRTDSIVSRESRLPRSVRDYFCEHFYVTTSGNFSPSALQCSLAELGSDSIMFSVDWPWATNVEGISFIEDFPADVSVKKKILHQNVERLLRL